MMTMESPVFLPARSRKFFRIVATLVAGGLLAACGYKGPLYLPKPDAASRQTTPAAAPADTSAESADPSATPPVEAIPVPSAPASTPQ
jgi:predicted small lipoprotein YifL